MAPDDPHPPTRESLYPEPHRAPGWQPDAPSGAQPVAQPGSTPPKPGLAVATPRKPRTALWVSIGVGGVLLLGVAFAGWAYGRVLGTETVIVTDPDGVSINAIQAEPGTCLQDIGGDGNVAAVTAVPCTARHRAEVVASYEFAPGEFPGTETARSEMLEYCGSVIQPGFSGGSMFQPGDWAAGVRWVAWAPTVESWDLDERAGVCVAYRDADMVGSFVGGTITFAD